MTADLAAIEAGPDPMLADDVARLSRPAREARVRALIVQSCAVMEAAIIEAVTSQRRTVAAVALLYSGGNDSTVLAHLFRGRATHAVHANTGIGIEETRQFVRDTCAAWGLPLMEMHPPMSYRDLVLDQGFPGPAHHWKMYTRLKERCIEAARSRLVLQPYRERVVFLAGRRRDESARRADLTWVDRKRSMVFVSPMLLWTKLDLNTYRLMAAADGDPVPLNPVTERLHMSGECLCGAFAHPGELDEIGAWFPAVRAEIEALEADVTATGRHPAWRCRWGWGADKGQIQKLVKAGEDPDVIAAMFARSAVGTLCSSCDEGAA